MVRRSAGRRGRRLWSWWLRARAAGSTAYVLTVWLPGVPFWLPVGVSGALTGLLQWLLLRRGAALPLLSLVWWVAGSLASECVLFGPLHGGRPDQLALLALVAGLAGAFGGVLQWRALAGRVWWAQRWIAVSVVSSAAGWPLGVVLGRRLLDDLTGWTVGWLLSAALSGAAAASLLSTSPPETPGAPGPEGSPVHE